MKRHIVSHSFFPVPIFASLLAVCFLGCSGSSEPERSAEELIQEAQSLMGQGQVEATRPLVDELEQRGVESPEVHLLAGELASREGELERALEYYEKIPIENTRTGQMALFARGEVLRTLGKLSRAERAFEQAFEFAPEQDVVRRRLGQLAMITGRRDRARRFLEPLLKRGEVDFETLVAFGDRELRLTHRKYLEECVASAPDDPLPLLGLANWSLTRGLLGEAESFLERASEQTAAGSETEAVVRLMLARIAFQQSEAREFEKALARLPKRVEESPCYWLLAGHVEKQRGNSEAAVRAYWEVLKRDPDHRPAMYAMGQLLATLEMKEIAQPMLERVTKLERIRELQTSVSVAPGQMPPQDFLKQTATGYQELGRYYEAAGWAKLAFEAYPELAWPRELLREVLPILERDPPRFARKHPVLQVEFSQWPMPVLVKESTAVASSDFRQATEMRANFENMAASYGIEFEYFASEDPATEGKRMFEWTGGGVAALDFDADGYRDLYFTQGAEWPVELGSDRYLDALYRNLDGDRFEEVAGRSEVYENRFSQGVAVGDVNQDGFPDIYVANIGQNQLFENNGDGTFSPIELPVSEKWTTSVAIADLDGDGFPELYDVNYLSGDDLYAKICSTQGRPRTCNPQVFPAERDECWRNSGEGSFVTATSELGFVGENGKGLGIAIADFERDGGLEVYIANDSVANFHYVRDQDGRYVDEALLSGTAFGAEGRGQASMGIALGDFDGNQLLDMGITNFYLEPNTLYLNEGTGLFTDVGPTSGMGEATRAMLGFGAEAIDYNLDGREDLVLVNGDIDDFSFTGREYRMKPQLFANSGNNKRLELMAPEHAGAFFGQNLLGRGLAVIDVENDGRLEFAVSLLEGPAALVKDQVEREANWFGVRLVSTGSERSSVGAHVVVEAGGKTLYRQVTAGDGYQSSNQKRLVFGLGEHKKIDRVSIEWPSGRVESIEGLMSGRNHLAVEGTNVLSLP